jgi:hypothetical protein
MMLFFCFLHLALVQAPLARGDRVFDVVALAVDASCVSPFSLRGLNRYFSVRNIHVVSSSAKQCDLFTAMADNVECHTQDAFLPGVTRVAVEEHFLSHFSDEISRKTASARSGWYLQQLLKLGAPQAIPSLSEYFLVWDLDMVPLRKASFLLPSSEASVPYKTRVDVSSKLVQQYATSYQVCYSMYACLD